jgi:Caspase domain
MNADPAADMLPDPAHSRAVLIGGSDYASLPTLSSVRNNLGALAAILCDPDVWGLSEDHCRVILNPASFDQVVEPIKEAAEPAIDTLLVYYAGHGLTDSSGDFHLTVRDSDVEKSYTQVLYKWVRDPIRNSRARRRIVILDCCYSGRAANLAMGNDAPYAEQAYVDGSFIFTATPENREALAPSDQKYTAFTHELVTVLEEGLSGGGAHVSLNEIFNHVKARLRSKSLPQPEARDRNNLGAQTCFRNKAFVPGGVRPELTPERRDAESQEAVRRVRGICLRASADFLRRERLPAHDALYLGRPIDSKISAAIRELSPVNLRRVRRPAKQKRQESGDGAPTARVAPSQVMVLSDDPGSGKTMLAVQLSRLADEWSTVLRRATDPVADDLRSVVEQLGPDLGMSLLLRARMPIVLIVDGLDQGDAGDQKQVIELFKAIGELNEHARRERLLAYPLMVLFTIRESEWDRLFTLFEGRNAIELRSEISRFTPQQLEAALDKYALAYEYELHGEIPPHGLDKLALPLNIRILSESHEYRGETDAGEALEEHILSGYMRRKADLILPVLPGLTDEGLTAALTALAMELVERRTLEVDAAVTIMVGALAALPRQDVESLLRALIDEQVLERTVRGVGFRQPGVLEYLLAAEGVRQVNESGRAGSLEDLTSKVAASSPTSSAAVRSSVEEIVRTQDPGARQMVSEHYATSAVYTGSQLSTLRFELSAGGRTSTRDLDSIFGSLYALQPVDAWDAFFVVVAAANRQPADRILKAFVVAWDANGGRVDRWKLLYKARERQLLYRPEVLRRVLRSAEPRDWETLLGSLAQERERQRLLADLGRLAERPLAELVGHGPEWRQVNGLLDLLLDGGTYVSGEVW